MVRQILIASAIVLSATPLVTAQQRTMKGAPPPTTTKQTPAPPPPRMAPPPPQPQTVAPPLLLPMAPLTLPRSGGLTGPVPFTPGQPSTDIFRNGRRDPFRNRSRYPILSGYGGGYLYGAEPDTTQTPPAPSAPPVATGGLRITGTPGDAQVFVDSYFVGTVADIEAGRPLTITAGPHRLEIRAAGYQTIVVDIQITAYETLTYHAALDRLPQQQALRTSAAAASGPMYLIPNCYLGNVPPRPSRLPSGCDIKRVQVLGAK